MDNTQNTTTVTPAMTSPMLSSDDFNFSDNDYAAFKSFVKEKNFSFQTKTEKLLEESINADDTLLGPEVQEKYKDLLLAVNKGKITALDNYKNEIKKNLEDEIIIRYFYREGLYKYYLKHDDAILAAKELLANDKIYSSILE